MRSLFFVVLVFLFQFIYVNVACGDSVSVSPSGVGQPSSVEFNQKDAQIPKHHINPVPDAIQAKSLGEEMVDFIRKLLGDKPEPVDEKLVRDEE
ncbi:MAG: hypothetical protein HQM16_05260 [Deltaproteobacteria bacterium]|nr:hypothetical protein [Deltaproteobacteria bacterium]